MKNQTFGIEIETTGLGRRGTAQAIAAFFGTTARYIGAHLDNWEVPMPDGRHWMVESDASVTNPSAEVVSPVCRDYLKVGYYTEVVFPGLDIRFIAINNGVDSANQQDSDFTPFLNIINEWYAKDTSKKIRAVFKSKGLSGKLLATNVPYGYRKDPEDKTHWLVDEDAA